jgi:hypothetical protein
LGMGLRKLTGYKPDSSIPETPYPTHPSKKVKK